MTRNADREARLAEKLRENLRLRKARARGVDAAVQGDGDEESPPGAARSPSTNDPG